MCVSIVDVGGGGGLEISIGLLDVHLVTGNLLCHRKSLKRLILETFVSGSPFSLVINSNLKSGWSPYPLSLLRLY